MSANSIYAPINENLLVTASGSAAWTTASIGEVTYLNVGWSDTIGDGNANLNANTGWLYTFKSNVNGSFVIDYSVTAQGVSSTTSNPLFGLVGFYLYEGTGLAPPSNPAIETGLNTSGSISLAIAVGQTYTVQIQDFANISGGIGTTDAHRDGTFEFGVQTQGVPEPTSLCMASASALVGAVLALAQRSSGGRPGV